MSGDYVQKLEEVLRAEEAARRAVDGARVQMDVIVRDAETEAKALLEAARKEAAAQAESVRQRLSDEAASEASRISDDAAVSLESEISAGRVRVPDAVEAMVKGLTE